MPCGPCPALQASPGPAAGACEWASRAHLRGGRGIEIVAILFRAGLPGRSAAQALPPAIAGLCVRLRLRAGIGIVGAAASGSTGATARAATAGIVAAACATAAAVREGVVELNPGGAEIQHVAKAESATAAAAVGAAIVRDLLHPVRIAVGGRIEEAVGIF